MTTSTTGYNDITETKPRITTFEENGIRTTTKTTRIAPDPNEKPKETVTVKKVDRPDATETITITEKKLPPIRYTETITREKVPKKGSPPQIQIVRPTPTNAPTNDLSPINPNGTSIVETYPPTEVSSGPKTYNIVRRQRIADDPTGSIVTPARADRVYVTQPDRISNSRVLVRQTPDPTSLIQVPNTRSTRIVEVRQPASPVIVDVSTPPLTTRKTTTIVNDTNRETLIDDRRTLVNYEDDYYSTRRTGRRSEWCGDCGADCLGCNCFDDCCGTTNCCRTNSFAKRKDVASYRTRVTKDGRRVRYRNADVPGYRCCNCCTGWCSRVCPCCACLEWFCACPCWLWLCCLIPLLLALLGLSIGLLTQLPAITSNNNNNNVETLRVIEQTVNETWYIYGSDQPCAGSATTFPPSLSTITTLIPCAQTTTSWARIIQATTVVTRSTSCKTLISSSSFLFLFVVLLFS